MAAARSSGSMTLVLPSDREIVMTRVFHAPRRLVFEAHRKCEHIQNWWGPRRYTMSNCEMDFRPGGAWRFVQRGPDGREFGFRGVYREIVAPERIVQTFEFDGMPGQGSLETLALVEEDGKTTLTSRSVFQNREDRDAMIRSGMEAGARETMDRLDGYLDTMVTEGRSGAAATADREIVATRVFDAPRELVYQMWTDPKHIQHWWGPNGFTNTIHRMEVRPGGVWDFIMHGPDGRDYHNKIVYLEVVKPERIVYDHVSGPTFHVTATFAEEGKKTRLTVRMLFESAAQRDQVAEEFGAVEGLSQTLGRLAAYLAKP